ncbi:MAG: DMT family transporter [Actinomycetota bacterium]|nr:DMT family transporter [Actinomycetota bacterium]
MILAFGSALAFAIAQVGQQRVAARASDEDARSGRFIGQLLRNPRWIAATVGDWGGYGLQAAALAFGSVLIVQPILVTSLLFALPLGAYLSHRSLGRSAAASGVLLSVSLAAFLVLANPNAGADRGSARGWLVASIVGVPIVLGCTVAANRRTGAVRASLLAVGVGVLGGVLSVLTKAVANEVDQGLLHLLTTGEVYGLAVVGIVGIYLQQLAFQAGSIQASLPIMTVLEPFVAVLLGMLLLHEQVRASGFKLAVILVSVVAMAVSTIALARDRGRSADAEAAEGTTPAAPASIETVRDGPTPR